MGILTPHRHGSTGGIVDEGLIRHWAHIVESKDIEEGIGLSTDRDGLTYKTINGKSNEEDIARRAASVFVHMVASNVWHSSMKEDERPGHFDIPFTRFSGAYLGSLVCENPQKHSVEELYMLLGSVESILNGKPIPYDHDDISKRMADGILRQMKNKVKLSTVYDSNTGKDDPVITIKPGSYHLEAHQGSTDNLTIDVEVEEEIRLSGEDNELMNDLGKSLKRGYGYRKPNLPKESEETCESGKFCSKDECGTRQKVVDQNPGAQVVVKVEGGWMAFATEDDYETWRKQR